MNIVLLGAPGAGKGTQAKKIHHLFGIPHISAGDLLRDAVSRGTPEGVEAETHMKAGQLVPNDLILAIISDKLSGLSTGFILDGFPRTLPQARKLDSFVHLDIVISIDVPFESLLERLTGRRSCPSCGGVFHMIFNPPRTRGTCDLCGENLVHRADDNEETVSARIDTYVTQTQPLIDYYEDKGIISHVDGTGDIDSIFDDIKKELIAVQASE